MDQIVTSFAKHAIQNALSAIASLREMRISAKVAKQLSNWRRKREFLDLLMVSPQTPHRADVRER